MKKISVHLPSWLLKDILAESRRRKISKSRVVRERLEGARKELPFSYETIADLAGSVKDDHLPRDLSSRVKHYLRVIGYGKNRADGHRRFHHKD